MVSCLNMKQLSFILWHHTTLQIWYMNNTEIWNCLFLKIIGIQMHVWDSNLEWMFDRCFVDCLLSLHFLEMKWKCLGNYTIALYISNQSLISIVTLLLLCIERGYACSNKNAIVMECVVVIYELSSSSWL